MPLLLVDRVAYSDDGEVVETARDVFRGDRTRIVAWTRSTSSSHS